MSAFNPLRAFQSIVRGVRSYYQTRRRGWLITWVLLYERLRIESLLHFPRSMERLVHRHEVRLCANGKKAFRRLLRGIERAQVRIVVHMFIWKDDATGRQVASALLHAANRGVRVSIYKDTVGDIFEVGSAFLATKDGESTLWHSFWNHPCISIQTSPFQNHAKIVIVDDDTLFLSGMNICDESRYLFHDYLIELHGAHYVEALLLQRKGEEQQVENVRIIQNGERIREIRPVLHQILRRAERSVIVEHCYISDPEVLSLLAQLTHRNVRVTVIIPAIIDFHYHGNIRSMQELLRRSQQWKIRILRYNGPSHAKVVLIDKHCAFFGSANLLTSSLDAMGEVNVLIRGRSRALRILREHLRRDIALSPPFRFSPWWTWISKWLSYLWL